MKILCIHRNTWREFLLTYLRRRNLVAPNKPDREEKMQKIRDNNEEKFIGHMLNHQ